MSRVTPHPPRNSVQSIPFVIPALCSEVARALGSYPGPGKAPALLTIFTAYASEYFSPLKHLLIETTNAKLSFQTLTSFLAQSQSQYPIDTHMALYFIRIFQYFMSFNIVDGLDRVFPPCSPLCPFNKGDMEYEKWYIQNPERCAALFHSLSVEQHVNKTIATAIREFVRTTTTAFRRMKLDMDLIATATEIAFILYEKKMPYNASMKDIDEALRDCK
ncbi:hypothetical protein HDU76_007430 [Blyttiomyces sp. JEL0837]|nr:hypothetical protein HDU76_007430 [Blyttiomyces sp. JEL0837]